ncbi:hypothetical protein AK830_g3538 [Neonectria ditissima]|uniref:FAD/NAD(P)-binding domain-containing protein n=1 Tax=Neonectria ditissima TaxID=78410 RepID=A0A0N8H7X8_9HYPO|nr:hypothetical protein AK830_g3538 [Neonectria ditissima]
MAGPSVIIIGGGVAGIAMAHTLKCKLGFTNFTIYEKNDGLGGTWRVNTYPGCGSDVPIHLYSFSFNLNPNWSQELVDQKEILDYVESTVDKFRLRSHFQFKSDVLSANWIDDLWHVEFVDTTTGKKFTKTCNILLSAVGGFSQPRGVNYPGMNQYKGDVFHTAEWDHSVDLKGKRVAVIGNGCSAAQVVPSIAPQVQKLTQYARSPQWYHPRPNKVFSGFDKFLFRYVPLWQRWHRLDTFLKTDQLASVYGSDTKQVEQRLAIEESARQYIYETSPKKYHSFLVPTFPLGCKRRIYDPGYLACLHRDNFNLLPEGPQEFTDNGIISETGKQEDFDVVILATGFKVQSFLTPMKIVGKNGVNIHEQWSKNRGAQAYMGTFVHNQPNFAILFGPNTFPAFNSVIYAIEVQVAYITSTLIKPVIDGYANVVEVKAAAEEGFVENLDKVLAETVFAAGCSNWYINSAGRNSAAWPGLAVTFWKATAFPKWNDFVMAGGSNLWLLRKAQRIVTKATWPLWVIAASMGVGAVHQNLFASTESISTIFSQLKLGFGQSLVPAVLARGDKVIATARQVSDLSHLEGVNNVEIIQLDVTASREVLCEKVEEARNKFGTIDVLVNNAGYVCSGVWEELSSEDIKRQFETNFFGALNLTSVVLPTMRRRRTGTVLFMGSIAGWHGVAAGGAYSATKFALEGAAECLAKEVDAIGIRVHIFVLGQFRTKILDATNKKGKLEPESGIEEYAEIKKGMADIHAATQAAQPGDPLLAVERMIDIVKLENLTEEQANNLPLRIAVGSDAVDTMKRKSQETLETLQTWTEFSCSTDFPDKETLPSYYR